MKIKIESFGEKFMVEIEPTEEGMVTHLNSQKVICDTGGDLIEKIAECIFLRKKFRRPPEIKSQEKSL